MSNGSRDLSPTHSAALELKEERQLVREGYDFLDEKRLLLASELLHELSRYEEQMSEFNALHDTARIAIASAAMRHGLHGLQVYAAAPMDGAQLQTTSKSYLGVVLNESKLVDSRQTKAYSAEFPSPEAERCRKLFSELLRRSAEIAAITGNLFRLVDEYRHTERRARALEDVLLPEIEESLREILAHLEDSDLEEVIRTRLNYRR